MCQACVRSVVLFFNGTWTVKEEDFAKQARNAMMMVWWICTVTLKDRKSSDKLRGCLGLVSIGNCIQEIAVEGKRRPRKSMKEHLSMKEICL